MFTGIVTDIGIIDRIEPRGDARVIVRTGYPTGEIALGASVACSGVCLTVVDKGVNWLAFDVSAETMRRSAPGQWTAGRRLNLERALKVGDELGGHIVTGHVDGIAQVAAITPEGDSWQTIFAIDRTLAPFVAAKGSIAIDGVSLTVNEVTDQSDGSAQFGINLIPHTRAVTTLGDLAVGSAVNVEIDVLARYLRRMEQLRTA